MGKGEAKPKAGQKSDELLHMLGKAATDRREKKEEGKRRRGTEGGEKKSVLAQGAFCWPFWPKFWKQYHFASSGPGIVALMTTLTVGGRDPGRGGSQGSPEGGPRQVWRLRARWCGKRRVKAARATPGLLWWRLRGSRGQRAEKKALRQSCFEKQAQGSSE